MEEIRKLSEEEIQKLAKIIVLLGKEYGIEVYDFENKIDGYVDIEVVSYTDIEIYLRLRFGKNKDDEKLKIHRITISRKEMEVTENISEDEIEFLKNQPKNIAELVERLFNSYKDHPQFKKDIEDNSRADFSIMHHHGLGTDIRNTCGFWRGITPVYIECREAGIKHPDDMSGYVLLRLHDYAKKQFQIA